MFRNTARRVRQGKQTERQAKRDRRRTNNDALGEQLGLDDALPEQERVFQPVYAPVLCEQLVEARNGREEQDRVRIIKVRIPRSPLRPRREGTIMQPVSVPCGGADMQAELAQLTDVRDPPTS